MGWYARFLAGTVPSYYLRRSRALTHVNVYDAEKASRTHQRKTETRGPNASTRNAHKVLRDVVREMEQNNDLISGALDVLVANVVGPGLEPEPMVRNKDGSLNDEVNEQIGEAYRIWSKRPEVTWEYDEGTAQRLTARTWLRDGECLIQHILGPMNTLQHGSNSVPYSYELIEPDLLVVDRLNRTDRVVEGVELNAWRRPVAYHLYKEHQNDILTGSMPSRDSKRVPAEFISHLKLTNRINQVRGITKFHNVIKRINDVNEIDETERVAARVAAAFAAVIVKGDPQLYDSSLQDDNNDRLMELQPGMIFDDLEQGEKVESIGSNRPNNELIPFRASQLRAGAGGIGISYSSWSKDYNGTYSSQRQELVEQHRLYTPPWAYFVCKSERPKYQNVVNAMRLTGALRIPSSVRQDTLFDALWTQPAVAWIDPLKEAKGWQVWHEMGAESLSGVIRARGKNPRDIRKQRKLEDEENEGKVVEDPGEGRVHRGASIR